MEDGVQGGDGAYTHDTLTQKVLLFLQKEENAFSSQTVTFLYDKAPCMQALATQQLLKECGTDIFGNDERLGNAFFLIAHM